MAFNIRLQRSYSEKNRIAKTIADIITVTGVLKEETSIIDPVIKIECDLADVKDCNYMTISAFGRSYFVNNIRSIRNGLVEFSCHVDVLETYRSGILNNSAILKRSESTYNLYLNDGSFKVYQNSDVLTKEFPSGFTTQEFILAVAGS